MAKMGRPLKEIDQEQFESLCSMQCTEEEIAVFFNTSVDTIERWCKRTYKQTFADVFKEKRKLGHISLRRKQWNLATDNVAMAIWLGKQYLGQREPEQNYNIKNLTIEDETLDRMREDFAYDIGGASEATDKK